MTHPIFSALLFLSTANNWNAMKTGVSSKRLNCEIFLERYAGSVYLKCQCHFLKLLNFILYCSFSAIVSFYENCFLTCLYMIIAAVFAICSDFTFSVCCILSYHIILLVFHIIQKNLPIRWLVRWMNWQIKYKRKIVRSSQFWYKTFRIDLTENKTSERNKIHEDDNQLNHSRFSIHRACSPHFHDPSSNMHILRV